MEEEISLERLKEEAAAGYDFDIAFLTGLFPKTSEAEIYKESKGGVQSAANALQWSIAEGLDQNNRLPVRIINSIYIGTYPWHYKSMTVKTFQFSHGQGAEDINVGFTNLFILKHFSKYFRLKPFLREWALEGRRKKVLIGYALTAEFIACIHYIKKVNPEVKTIMVVPDLLEYMNTSEKESLLYRVLKSAESGYIMRNIRSVDGFVILTELMKDAMGIGNNFAVVEGIATDTFKNIGPNRVTQSGEKIILYTGTLNKKFGVLNLVEAFKMIPGENYRLILCGTGDLEKKIQEEEQSDRRIIFKGLVSREEALRLQQEATVLINPRQNNEEYTKYSFPSKVLEYLCSGTPVIAYKLDGIPDEYDKYIHYIEDNSLASLKAKIIEICESDREERLRFGNMARDFVLTYKNKKVQAKKILDLAAKL